MADSLYPKLIILGVFCGVTTFLFMAISPIIQSGAMMNDPNDYRNSINIPGETFYAPNPYVVTNTSVKNHYTYGHDSVKYTSVVNDRHDIDCWVVRGNDYFGSIVPKYNWMNDFEDCILFQMYFGWLGLEEKHAAISFETIAKNFKINKNYSKVDFMLDKEVSLFIGTGLGYSFPIGLYANHFNMSIGWLWNASDEVSESPWALIGQVLSFQIPEIGPTLNYMIGIPVYLTIGFLILAVASRFMPTVPGL